VREAALGFNFPDQTHRRCAKVLQAKLSALAQLHF